MNTFIYHDSTDQKWELMPDGHGHWVSKVIFQCEADTIMEADQMLSEATGIKLVGKTNPYPPQHITCEVKKSQD